MVDELHSLLEVSLPFLIVLRVSSQILQVVSRYGGLNCVVPLRQGFSVSTIATNRPAVFEDVLFSYFNSVEFIASQLTVNGMWINGKELEKMGGNFTLSIILLGI